MKMPILKSFISFIILLLTFSFAIPYSPIETGKLLRKTPNGTIVNLNYLQNRVLVLSRFAGQYPTNFATEAQKNAATQEAVLLLQVTKHITKKDQSAAVLYLSMQVSNLAYNLDVNDSANYLLKYTTHFIHKYPNHPSGYFFLGTFLINAGHTDKGQIYIQKALDLGDDRARLAFVLLDIMKDDPDSATVKLNNYHYLFPNDETARQMISTLQEYYLLNPINTEEEV